MSQIVIATGKRKTAVARAYLKYPGRGRILINKKPLELIEPWLVRNTIEEPLLFISDQLRSSIDIIVNVKGGGVMGQAQATRMAIANALVQFTKSEELRQAYLAYNPALLKGDPRQVEPKKPRGKKARAKRQKSYR
ncbi:MAG: 30S ribosomal protein S9 [Thermoproteota archaeon]|jgi:small subunit ribosomal protein S9|nr:30S ribosomal protein S9 [Thermoproteota archaeon]